MTKTELQARVSLLESLLTRMSDMYGNAWDITPESGGGLWLSPESVQKWEELSAEIRIALGKPLYGDLPGDWEDE